MRSATLIHEVYLSACEVSALGETLARVVRLAAVVLSHPHRNRLVSPLVPFLSIPRSLWYFVDSII